MAKIIPLLFFLFLSVFNAQAQDTASIVNNATEVSASKSEIIEAKNNTEFFITNIDRTDSLLNMFMIIGPLLWEKIKNEPDFKDIAGNVILKIPKFTSSGKPKGKKDAKGKILQDLDTYKKLCRYLQLTYNLSNAQIDKINNKDKFILWLYFAKIEEPALAIQSDKGRLVFKYVAGKLFFIEITSD